MLDVGAWDAYFSFLAERRGATSVLAIDPFQNEGEHSDTEKGFALSKSQLASHVEYRRIGIEGLPDSAGPFDSILFLGVYYHLKNPLAALEKAHRLLRPGGRLYLEGLIRLGLQPDLHYYAPEDIEPTTYCAATVSGVERMAKLAGFTACALRSRTDGIQTKAWFYSSPPSRLRWGLISAYRSRLHPRARPRGFFELIA